MRWPWTRTRIDESRWVVLDVEASGLDARRERLLAIAAVAVHIERGRPRIVPADSFEAVLRQDGQAPTDKANILLHGIGVGAQRAGAEPAEVLAGFARYAGNAPLLAFHAAFDRTLLDRDARALLGRRLADCWIDVANLAHMLHPDVSARALDDWMAYFGLRCAQRHQAAADALVTAELLLRLWPGLPSAPGSRYAQVRALAAQRRWVGH